MFHTRKKDVRHACTLEEDYRHAQEVPLVFYTVDDRVKQFACFIYRRTLRAKYRFPPRNTR